MYAIQRFGSTWAGGKALPLYEGRQPLDSDGSMSGMIELPGGRRFDANGANRAPAQAENFTLEGVLSASTVANLETLIDEWKALRGSYSKAWAQNAAESVRRWRSARLLRFRCPEEIETLTWARATFVFELSSMGWFGETQRDSGAVVIDLATHDVPAANSGNRRVLNPIIKCTCLSATPITAIHIDVPSLSAIVWANASGLTNGQYLTIDCGARSVLRSTGADEYAYLSKEAAHTLADWLALDPGTTNVQVSFTGGGVVSTCQITNYDGWE